jgi:hypothetical protein
MKRALSLAIIISLFVACAPKNLPPELKPAYTANEILIRIQELQKTTIGLYDATPRAISKERADLIVKFTIVAAEATQKSLQGWQQTIKSAWAQLNQQLLVPDKGLETLWNLVDAMIGAL